MRSSFDLCAASICLASTAQAQAVDMSNEAFWRVAVTVILVDHAYENCERSISYSADDKAQHAAWQRAHGVDEIRSRIHASSVNPEIRKSTEEVKSSASAKFRGSIDACAFFRSAVGSRDAQFAISAPAVLSALKKADVEPSGAVIDKPKLATVKDTSAAQPKSTPAILAQIDSIGFDFRPIAGYGGVTMDAYPVVLFRSGDLLMDVTALAHPGGLEAHKKSKPDKWQKWRRSEGKLQRISAEGWRNLAFQVSYPKLPDGFKLNGKFNSTSGIGSGGESVVAWRQYQFDSNGEVTREGGVGSNSQVAESSTVSKTVAPNRKGRYRVEGLTLRIAYEDGTTESFVLVTDPKDPRAIWLDGVGYTQARK